MHFRTQAHALEDGIAGVVERARAPAMVGWLRQVLFAHGLVMLKPAGCQHHRLAGLDTQRATVALDLDADHPALLLYHAGQGGVAPQGNIPIHHGGAQARDAGTAGSQAAVVAVTQSPGDIHHIGRYQFERDFPPSRLLADQQGGLLLGDADHAGEVHHRVSAAQVPPFLAQFIGSERLGLHRAVPCHGAIEVGVIVGVMGQADIANPGVPVQKLHHFRAVFQIGVQLVLGHLLGCDQLAQVRFGGGDGVLGAGGPGVAIAGYPDAAAGDRAGATVQVGLLHHQYIRGAHFKAAQRRGEATVAGTDHHHIKTVIPLLLDTHATALPVNDVMVAHSFLSG